MSKSTRKSSRAARASRFGVGAVLCILVALAARAAVEGQRLADSNSGLEQGVLLRAIAITAVATLAAAVAISWWFVRPAIALGRSLEAAHPDDTVLILRKEKSTVRVLINLGLVAEDINPTSGYLGLALTGTGIEFWGNVPRPARIASVPVRDVVAVRDRGTSAPGMLVTMLTSGLATTTGNIEVDVRSVAGAGTIPIGPLKWKRTAHVELSTEERRDLVRAMSALWGLGAANG